MKVYLAFQGKNEPDIRNLSWQEEFPKTVKCVQKNCKGECRLGFIAYEAGRKGTKEKFLCEIYENMKDNKLWPHDCVAVAVYFCEKCLEVTALYNQA